MLRKLNYLGCALYKFFKYTAFLLYAILSHNVNAVPNNTTLDCQQIEETTKQPQKKGWWHRKYAACSELFGSYCKFTTVPDATSQLQHLFDDNNLYQTLEAFDNKDAFELLALLYINMLFIIDKLNNEIIQAGLSAPPWIENYTELTKEIKDKSGLCLITSQEKHKYINKTDAYTKKILDHSLNSCFSMLKTLLKFQADPFKPESVISDILNKRVKYLLSKTQNPRSLSAKENWIGLVNLQKELLVSYTAGNMQETPQYPVLASLVNWCENNDDSKISKLLQDSNCWAKQPHSSVTEGANRSQINTDHHMLFSYLHYDKKNTQHDSNEPLHNCETTNIVNDLLNSDSIVSLTKDIQTVKLLVANYSDGLTALDAMHYDRSQQEKLTPEEKAAQKKYKQKGKFSQKDWNEYLNDGIKKNIKESLLGKVISGVSYIFDSMKSNFITTLTKQKQSKKVITDWFNLLQRNTLALKYKNKDEGLKLVIEELITLKNIHGDEITIANAFTKIVERRFNGERENKAFTILTGLQREINILQKAPVVSANLDNNANDYEIHKKHVDNNKEGNKSDASEAPPLHEDWYSIKKATVDSKQEHEKDDLNTVWIGSNYNSSFYRRLIMGTVLALSVVALADASPSVSNYQSDQSPHNNTQIYDNFTLNSSQTNDLRYIMEANTNSSSDVINISNITILNLIGRHENYPSNGDYLLTSSIDASDFIEPIPEFTGNLNGGNNTIYHMPYCLMDTLSGDGIVQNISFNNANITNTACASIIASIMNKNSTVSLIKIKDSFFISDSKYNITGIVAGSMSHHSRIEHVTIVNSTITTSEQTKSIGGLVGVVQHHGTIEDITIFNVTIESYGTHHIGGIVGLHHSDAMSRDVTICNSTIDARRKNMYIGGGYGYVEGSGTIKGIVIINTHINVLNDGCHSGGAAGILYDNAHLEGIVLINTIIKIKGSHHITAFVAGASYGAIECSHIRVINSHININNTLENNSYSSISFISLASGTGLLTNIYTKYGHISDLAVLNSSMTLAVHTDFIFKPCALIKRHGTCDMVIGVSSTKLNNSDYTFTMSNTINQCSWINLPFLTDDCEIKQAKFKEYEMNKMEEMPTIIGTRLVYTENMTTVSRTNPTTSSSTYNISPELIGLAASVFPCVCCIYGVYKYCLNSKSSFGSVLSLQSTTTVDTCILPADTSDMEMLLPTDASSDMEMTRMEQLPQ
ncbi:MAG: hypothetical protein QS748_06025 [Candidatus Endonucleobacter bathymodioli]|uniref:Right handed beta helix domain-containing protein n=1 Tax=Candidatus Endonucleibacter bathymodioli TaxID=539814 RepID=A0AA90P0L3_9GAMM|nr:hypothetical protein [Candidatus Endonucleobacter bathymodioli]